MGGRIVLKPVQQPSHAMESQHKVLLLGPETGYEVVAGKICRGAPTKEPLFVFFWGGRDRVLGSTGSGRMRMGGFQELLSFRALGAYCFGGDWLPVHDYVITLHPEPCQCV